MKYCGEDWLLQRRARERERERKESTNEISKESTLSGYFKVGLSKKHRYPRNINVFRCY